MRNVSQEFKDAADSVDNTPLIRIAVKWDGTNAVSEKANLSTMELTTKGSVSFGDLTTIQETYFGNVAFFNKDFRFTPYRVGTSDSPVDSSIWNYIAHMPKEGFEVTIEAGYETVNGDEYTAIFTGRFVDFAHNEISNIVTWTLVDGTWFYLQRKDSTEVYSGMDFAEIGAVYPNINFGARSHRTHHVWMDDDSFMNDAFKMSNVTLGFRHDDPETGEAEFQPMDRWYVNNRNAADDPEPLYYFSPTHSYTDISSYTNAQNRPTEVIVNFSPRYIGNTQVVFELDETIIIPANTTRTFYLKSTQPMYSFIMPTQGPDYAVTSGVGLNMKDFVSISFSFTAQQIILTMTNTHEYLSGVLRYLVVQGDPVYGSQSGREKRGSVVNGFKRSRSAGDPFYIQTRSHAKWLADVLIDRVKYMEPVRDVENSPPLFHMEIGDLVEYRLHRGYKQVKAFIGEISTVFDGESLFQSFKLVDFAYLYPAPNENYFVLGDALDDSKVVIY